MGLNRHQAPHPAQARLGALALLAAAAAFDGARPMADERINAQIASGALPPEDLEALAERCASPQACAQAASGVAEAALTRYAVRCRSTRRASRTLQRRQPAAAPGHRARAGAQPGGAGARRVCQGGLPRRSAPRRRRSDGALQPRARTQRLVADPEGEDEEPPTARGVERAATTSARLFAGAVTPWWRLSGWRLALAARRCSCLAISRGPRCPGSARLRARGGADITQSNTNVEDMQLDGKSAARAWPSPSGRHEAAERACPAAPGHWAIFTEYRTLPALHAGGGVRQPRRACALRWPASDGRMVVGNSEIAKAGTAACRWLTAAGHALGIHHRRPRGAAAASAPPSAFRRQARRGGWRAGRRVSAEASPIPKLDPLRRRLGFWATRWRKTDQAARPRRSVGAEAMAEEGSDPAAAGIRAP